MPTCLVLLLLVTLQGQRVLRLHKPGPIVAGQRTGGKGTADQSEIPRRKMRSSCRCLKRHPTLRGWRWAEGGNRIFCQPAVFRVVAAAACAAVVGTLAASGVPRLLDADRDGVVALAPSCHDGRDGAGRGDRGRFVVQFVDRVGVIVLVVVSRRGRNRCRRPHGRSRRSSWDPTAGR